MKRKASPLESLSKVLKYSPIIKEAYDKITEFFQSFEQDVLDNQDQWNHPTKAHDKIIDLSFRVNALIRRHKREINMGQRLGRHAEEWEKCDTAHVFRHFCFVLKRLVDAKKIAIDATKDGVTALYHSVKQGQTRFADVLLQTGADPSIQNVAGLSLLHLLASQKSSLENCLLAGAIIRAGVSPDVRTLVFHDTPLLFAAKSGNVGLGKVLIRYKANVNAKNDEGGRPLLKALGYRRAGFARMLILNKAWVDIVDENLNTPLHLAASYGLYSIVGLLFKRGANLLSLNKQRKKPYDLVPNTRKDKMRFNLATVSTKKWPR